MTSFKPKNSNPFGRSADKSDIVTPEDALNRELSEILTKYDHEQLAKLGDMIAQELAEGESDEEHADEDVADELAEHVDGEEMPENAADMAMGNVSNEDDI